MNSLSLNPYSKLLERIWLVWFSSGVHSRSNQLELGGRVTDRVLDKGGCSFEKGWGEDGLNFIVHREQVDRSPFRHSCPSKLMFQPSFYLGLSFCLFHLDNTQLFFSFFLISLRTLDFSSFILCALGASLYLHIGVECRVGWRGELGNKSITVITVLSLKDSPIPKRNWWKFLHPY